MSSDAVDMTAQGHNHTEEEAASDGSLTDADSSELRVVATASTPGLDNSDAPAPHAG